MYKVWCGHVWWCTIVTCTTHFFSRAIVTCTIAIMCCYGYMYYSYYISYIIIYSDMYYSLIVL